MEQITKSIIVAYTYNESNDSHLLVVGSSLPGVDIDIINAISGDEAKELYSRLVTKEEKK